MRTRVDASRQMLAELLAAIDRNNRRVPDKNRLFKAGFALLIPALVGCLAAGVAG